MAAVALAIQGWLTVVDGVAVPPTEGAAAEEEATEGEPAAEKKPEKPAAKKPDAKKPDAAPKK